MLSMGLLLRKTCNKCRQRKPLSSFHLNKDGKYGRRSYCKSCTAALRRKRHIRYRARDNRYSREYRAKHHERMLEYEKRWQKENPDKVRANTRNYRARRAGASGDHTAEEFAALVEHYGSRCLCCRERRELTADHVVPLTWGGSNGIANIQPLCAPCNSAKNNLHDTDYRPDGGAFARALAEREQQ